MSATLFGQYLRERNVISPERLKAASDEVRRRNRSLGQLAIDSGYLTQAEVSELNHAQRTTDMMLGELAVKRALLSQDDLERLIILQKATQVSLAQVLVESGDFSETHIRELELDYLEKQKLTRKLCERILTEIPQSESVQLCLNELIKGLQRICKQVVAVNAIEKEGQLKQSLPYVVLQKVSGPSSFHFGFAVCSDQVQKISTALTGTEQNQAYIPVKAIEHFSDIVVKNACAKMQQEKENVVSHQPKAFFIGEQMPAYRDMVGVNMVTEDGSFEAMFFTDP
ncbi:hypothetical protein [Simiduia agarivorans]|uniref:Uncharacterized protein n=1 Tax=Simiduia agarivorans (strain DSM 21679 / JCM 13881 / BCRC 17597 / SA1) TaxID=1117647 RepID=K4KE94_SIMAS|nr:hypothetical protein [Simiduia agarivorans]AFU97364.2 hypothetical protein M5M_00645 [Simiduia agarivorans SA1 = DSM 21679]